MLNHLSFGVRDLQIAGQFYDAVLASLGFRRVFENIMAIGYGIEDDQDISCLKLSAAPHSPGEGFHLASSAASFLAVDDFYR
ncbi:hypothetical protein [Undibacterium sp.]|uniref:hypothetical protein n=1 Tax=Undibacterium sp. TaxID=1914977 RepID=UPI0037510462